MNGCLKYGGILFILIGILAIVSGLGLFGTTADVAREQLAQVEAEAASEAEELGGVIGTGIGAAIMTGVSGGIGVVGAILLFIGIIAYFVGNSGMQRNKQIKLQEQELNMLRNETVGKSKD